MPEIYKIATVNINGMATPPRIAMPENFLQKLEIDIILLGKSHGLSSMTSKALQLTHRHYGAGDGVPDTRPYSDYEHSVSPY